MSQFPKTNECVSPIVMTPALVRRRDKITRNTPATAFKQPILRSPPALKAPSCRVSAHLRASSRGDGEAFSDCLPVALARKKKNGVYEVSGAPRASFFAEMGQIFFSIKFHPDRSIKSVKIDIAKLVYTSIIELYIE